jgi:ppGpp synthetase/RelA/SpoT-type nucleotidyltranferase
LTRPSESPINFAGRELETILAEVKAAIAQHSDDWLKLQDRIRNRFVEYQKIGTLRGAIYSVYTRSDRQPQDMQYRHLKSAAKIAEEIFLNRRGGTKSRSGQERKVLTKQKFTIYDVSDVIGVAIVCPFKSDVDRVVDQIERDCTDYTFSKIEKIKRHDRQDYQAVHMSLNIPEGRLRELQCEVQIKTAVQDAFAWKTHDLAYKPDKNTDPWFIEQFNRISQLLRTADDFSDELRDRLEEEHNVSLEKRRGVRADLLQVLRELISTIGNKQRRKNLRATRKKLREYTLRTGDKPDRAVLKGIEVELEKALQKYNYDANMLSLAVLCAIAPGSDGYIYSVRRHYDEWITEGSAGKGRPRARLKEWISCANLIAIAHYCLNDISSAIQFGEREVTRAGKLKFPELGQLHVNLAYYYAEHFSETRDPAHAKLAKTHAARAEKILGEKLHGPDSDSLGYVQIATATTIQDVEAGLEQCKAAFKQISAKPKENKMILDLATKFFGMHRELAYKRLSQMVADRT